MIIDIHAHIGNINQALFWAADDQTLERYASEAGVDLLCVSAAKSIMYDTTEGNLDLDRDLKKTSKLLGYVVVNPMFPDTINDLDLIQKNQKFRGAKIHPDYHGYDMKSQLIQDFLGKVADRVPLMLFHVSCMAGTGFAAATQILRFAKNNPKPLCAGAVRPLHLFDSGGHSRPLHTGAPFCRTILGATGFRLWRHGKPGISSLLQWLNFARQLRHLQRSWQPSPSHQDVQSPEAHPGRET